MMGNFTNYDYLLVHINKCWQLHREYKEVKDKIFFFIASLFMSVIVGAGLLIYITKSLTPQDLNMWHYILVHNVVNAVLLMVKNYVIFNFIN